MTQFNWARYLELAHGLATSADEASKRSAISRAYYAAYHVTRVFLKVQPRDNTDSHKIVWDAAQGDSRKPLQEAGRKGERLKQRRKQADYNSQFDNLDYFTKDSLETARRIVETIEALRMPKPSGSPPAGSIPPPAGSSVPPSGAPPPASSTPGKVVPPEK